MIRVFNFPIAAGVPNFGDAINVWMWPRLAPRLLSRDCGAEAVLLGAGTILNAAVAAKVASFERKIVLGSGYGYSDAPFRADPSWRFYCVRGPLTAARLGLDDSHVATDPAALVTRLLPPAEPGTRRPTFMPHLSQALRGEVDWREVTEAAGYVYLDPRWPIETVVAGIQGASVLVTEALHGAVIADTYRIPWIPVATNSGILAFKWDDWCRSVGLRYRPCTLPAFWGQRPDANLIDRAKRRIKRERAVRFLTRARRRGGGLSPDRAQQQAIEKLNAAFARFLHDHS